MTCLPCPVGTYKTGRGNQECTPCAENVTTESVASKMESDCYLMTCPLGYFRSSPRFCSACAVGEYQDVAGLTSCKSCGTIDGFEGSTFGSASIAETDCFPKCGQGLYLNETERTCNSCPIGQFKDAVSLATLCNPCPSGLTTNQEGATSLKDCSFSICPSGSFRAANERDCTECDYGYYQPLSNANIVTSCIPCPNGRTTLNKGATSQDFCVPVCPGGSAYNVAAGDCVECTIGYYRPAGINPPWCSLCPSGTTTISTGSTSCVAITVNTSFAAAALYTAAFLTATFSAKYTRAEADDLLHLCRPLGSHDDSSRQN
ncbi:signal peptide, cub and egf-like domain-containing protein 3 [Plakobranchus ocellatus]|uniref:Signal peptide, cub and egf-like domain-containing protein 3 n=1 Tax=Plakobranchus ocellatus TaxID=259542 RepID=A0AAV3ZTQ1_9GAST|nr:signal peptide, cub and egf-like domain-containing protein 3 [Plakobranchus ocellatus]